MKQQSIYHESQSAIQDSEESAAGPVDRRQIDEGDITIRFSVDDMSTHHPIFPDTPEVIAFA